MIELRWLIDKRSDAMRVLQFRETTTTTAEEFHETGMRRVRYMEWSEWKDVPEVIAESAAHGGDSK